MTALRQAEPLLRDKASPTKAPICLVVHQGFSVRYLLQTEILTRLLERGENVVVLAPAHEVGHVRAVVPPTVAVEALAPPTPTGRLQRHLRTLRLVLHGRYVSTAEEIWKRVRREAGTPRRRFQIAVLGALARSLSSARPLRRLVPRIEAALADLSAMREVLSSVRPRLVVLTSGGAFGQDAEVLRAARSLRLPVATVILSWDNTTSQGYPAGFGDFVVAWTETMKQELVELLDYRPEQVAVRGIGHFDAYHRSDPGFDRSATLRELGLDPARRTIVLATKSPNSYASNANVASILAEAMADGRLPNCQLVVRVHPIHYRRDAAGELIYAAVLDDYRRLAERYPGVIVSEPLVSGDSRGFVMRSDEMLALTRLMRSADVLVNMFSTMNLEGALLDKPLVNVCFELAEPPAGARHPGRYDIRSDAAETHNMRVIDSGGTRIAYSPIELVEHVAAYLADPTLDRDGRRRIVERECGPFGGSAGRAIADYLIYAAGAA